MWRTLQKQIRVLSERYSNLYTVCYLFFFFSMLLATAVFPSVLKSLLYPVFFEKQEVEGVIEEIRVDEVRVVVKGFRKAFLPAYLIQVDGYEIVVPASVAREYQAGDRYSYYVYVLEDIRLPESRDYVLWQGVIGILIEVFILLAGATFLFTEVGERERNRKERKRQEPQAESGSGQNYKKLSTKELYEQCLVRNLNVTAGKRKNRQYLENCLRNGDVTDFWRKEHKREEEGIERRVNIILAIGVFIMITGYARTIYFFIMLFR